MAVCLICLQGDLQAPCLKEREYTGPSPQSSGLLPQAPWSQVSTFVFLSFLLTAWSQLKAVLHQNSETEVPLREGTTAVQCLVSLRTVCLCVCSPKIMSSSSSPGGIIILTVAGRWDLDEQQ